jgi:hypothetical protein
MEIYDLDGTLSTANSTFDFIKLFHEENRNTLRLFCADTVRRILNRTKMNPERKRLILIKIYFFGLQKERLDIFFYNSYLEYFKNTLTKLGSEVLLQDNLNSVMLTGCTEIPAKQLGAYFGFKDTICTTFDFKNMKIRGIKQNSFANKKIRLIEEYLKQNNLSPNEVIYYTDDPRSESELIKLFGQVVIV